jgi:hypothetical protein
MRDLDDVLDLGNQSSDKSPSPPEGDAPNDPAILSAYKFALGLDWSIAVVNETPLRLEVSGEPDFERYCSGAADHKFTSRARTAVVQAIVAFTGQVQEPRLRSESHAPLGAPLDDAAKGRLGVQAKVHVKRALWRAINGPVDGEQSLYATLLRIAEAANRKAQIRAANAVEASASKPQVDYASIANIGRTPSPADASSAIIGLACDPHSLMTAVKLVFSNSMKWSTSSREQPVMTVAIKGCSRFEEIARNERLGDEKERARTAIIRAMISVASSMTREGLFNFQARYEGPGVAGVDKPPPLADRFRSVMQAEVLDAIASGGYEGLAEFALRTY